MQATQCAWCIKHIFCPSSLTKLFQIPSMTPLNKPKEQLMRQPPHLAIGHHYSPLPNHPIKSQWQLITYYLTGCWHGNRLTTKLRLATIINRSRQTSNSANMKFLLFLCFYSLFSSWSIISNKGCISGESLFLSMGWSIIHQ